MTSRSIFLPLLACVISLPLAGCFTPPGKPGPNIEPQRPEQVLDFPMLFSQNCAACHGQSGKGGAAISLANPVYLAVAGPANIQRTIASGVAGTMMPPFSKVSGGMLTDQQIAALAQGMTSAWGNASALSGQTPPAYAARTPGDAIQGQKSFAVYCASCHGVSGEGLKAAGTHTGSLVDSAYLALISDQGLRSIIIAGRPDQGMPDWRKDITGANTHPMSDQEVTDTVAWLVTHRSAPLNQPRP
jgi:mono/diheme cytochrome c family protein